MIVSTINLLVNKMRNILFYLNVNSEYPVQLRLAILLKQKGYVPLFCFNSQAHMLDKEIHNARARGFKVVHIAGANEKRRPDRFLTRTGFIKGERGNKKQKQHILNLGKLKNVAEEKIKSFQLLLQENSIKLVVLSSNCCAYSCMWLTKAAQDLNIKVCSLPFGMGTPDTNARKAYYSSKKRLYRPLNFITGLMFPKWKHHFMGKTFLYASYASVWIQELLDAAPLVPWSNQGGNADRIFVESPFMMDYYKAQKISADKLLLTGTLYDDAIGMALAEGGNKYRGLCKKLKLDPSKKMILVSLPPLMLSALGSPVSEYMSQEEALMALLAPLSTYTDTYNIVVSVHPRLNKETVREYLPRNIVECDDPIEKIVGLANMFINCQSTTCRMALGAGIPCLDYDFYRFRFACFNMAKGYKRVESLEAYKIELELWLSHSKLENMTSLAKVEKDYYCLKDGKNHQRIINAIDALLKTNKRKEAVMT